MRRVSRAMVTGLSLDLLEMDQRIQVYSLYGDLEEDVGYIPRKTGLFFPVGIPSAEHEIAHMVEMRNKERWTMTDFGFSKSNDEWKSTKNLFAEFISPEIGIQNENFDFR
jgi:hypothetical protein